MFKTKKLNIEQTVRDSKGLETKILSFIFWNASHLLTPIIPQIVKDSTFWNQNIMRSFFQGFTFVYFRNDCKHCGIFICLK